MAGSGPIPDPDSRRSASGAHSWTILPASGRPGPAPELPPLRSWSDQTRAWWAGLWATPQATQWDASGRTLHGLALLYEQVQLFPGRSAGALSEMRQIEDRHGLNPKAMAQLRWRIASPADASPVPALKAGPAGRKAAARRAIVLKLGGPNK